LRQYSGLEGSKAVGAYSSGDCSGLADILHHRIPVLTAFYLMQTRIESVSLKNVKASYNKSNLAY